MSQPTDLVQFRVLGPDGFARAKKVTFAKLSAELADFEDSERCREARARDQEGGQDDQQGAPELGFRFCRIGDDLFYGILFVFKIQL